jgi:hypothetical protein
MGKTTIQLEEETREALHELGSKGESYDAIIKRLLKRYKKGAGN